ncbi:MAG: response regulator transcription factor, partial [Bacteroidota bacterium]
MQQELASKLEVQSIYDLVGDAKENSIIHVLVVDDHAIIRKGIRAVLEITPDIELVGEAENGLQAV